MTSIHPESNRSDIAELKARLPKLRNWGKRFMLVFAGFFLALGLCELILRVFLPQNLSGTWRVFSATGLHINKAGGTAKHQFRDRVVHYRFNDHHLRGGPIGKGTNRVL